MPELAAAIRAEQPAPASGLTAFPTVNDKAPERRSQRQHSTPANIPAVPSEFVRCRARRNLALLALSALAHSSNPKSGPVLTRQDRGQEDHPTLLTRGQ